MADRAELIEQSVRLAFEAGEPLCIEGNGSKAFFGAMRRGRVLPVAEHHGITDYEPRELVIKARAGTPLNEVEEALAEEGQMLPFEPPHFGEATLGGTVACGLSGPRRPWCGAVRDFVLGVTLVNGRGEHLRFGGEVIKNVAGYDISRTMAGALGTLGVLLSVSLKVLPRPEREITLSRECTAREAIDLFNHWAARPLPLSGACHCDGRLRVRLSGTGEAVKSAARVIGGEKERDGRFWSDLREQHLPFFEGDRPLWRFSVPSDAPPQPSTDGCLVDWGGAQRWLRTDAPAEEVRAAAVAMGGAAHCFRGGNRREVFHPIPEPLMKLHRNLKTAFDPKGILNPGRLYADL